MGHWPGVETQLKTLKNTKSFWKPRNPKISSLFCLFLSITLSISLHILFAHFWWKIVMICYVACPNWMKIVDFRGFFLFRVKILWFNPVSENKVQKCTTLFSFVDKTCKYWIKLAQFFLLFLSICVKSLKTYLDPKTLFKKPV